jgi:hypothetical protein
MENAQTSSSSREARIIAAVCRELGIAWEDLYSRKRDQETATSRKLLYFVLYKAGYSRAHIAALLARHYSTVVDGLRKVECNVTLSSEGARLAALVLPFDGEAAGRPVPLHTLSRALVRALQGVAPRREVAAMRAYVCGTLLGRERVPATQALWGLYVLKLRPAWRMIVEELLVGCGLAAFCDLIDVQVQQAGLQPFSQPCWKTATATEVRT